MVDDYLFQALAEFECILGKPEVLNVDDIDGMFVDYRLYRGQSGGMRCRVHEIVWEGKEVFHKPEIFSF